MPDKKTRKLLDRIEALERENRNLKKKVGQYRKLVFKSADILLDKSDDEIILHINKIIREGKSTLSSLTYLATHRQSGT